MKALPFDDVARLPAPGDNVAIATRRLEADTPVCLATGTCALSHAVLEGHRFAAGPIAAGAALLSWGLPFGVARRDIEPGEYVCNAGMLEALALRRLDVHLPSAPNFDDRITPYQLDAATFEPAPSLPRRADPPTFLGFDRGPRGVGTRNHVVILGTSSRVAAFARQLAQRSAEALPPRGGFDGVVAVAHTEGGGTQPPNNRDLLLRTLAGFCVHPNVGAVLCVDYGTEAVNNAALQAHLSAAGLPIETVPHHFLSLSGPFDRCLRQGEALVRTWAETLGRQRRAAMASAHLKLALQCGGSDAFSGVSGNPLAAWAAREVIRCGGAAELAETDELIGAEPYLLARVRDLTTARRFLEMVERFKTRVAWHGASAEGNPSGGNKYRGLYNIALKSIGAAMKRHPEVPLDGCLEYAETIPGSGYWFMDSPGNDLESIAGQVASGCNLITFVTGNGSITNFPFVPTIKVLTTTPRYRLLAADMDVNAGAYQDGTPMDELGQALFARTLAVASGQRTRGEAAGHWQVSIWRDWPQADGRGLKALRSQPPPDGTPLPARGQAAPAVRIPALDNGDGPAFQRVGLVLPTSLCSGQVARLAAQRLNARGLGARAGVDRFAALVHTEGCGVSEGSEDIFTRLVIGYLRHPAVARALLLEHGCEKTHNDYVRARLLEAGVDPERFGYASVQLDGGIAAVLERVEAWFAESLAGLAAPATVTVGLEAVRLGLLAGGDLPGPAARALARLAAWVVGAGGTVVVPEGEGLATHPDFAVELGLAPGTRPSLAHGQVATPGLHVMAAPGATWTEALSGLGATGVGGLLAHVGQHPLAGHPLLPLVQVTAVPEVAAAYGDDLDAVLAGDADAWSRQLLDLLVAMASRRRQPRLFLQGDVDFQITRGLLGVSM